MRTFRGCGTVTVLSMAILFCSCGQPDVASVKSGHFEASAPAGSLAAQNLDAIVQERERAYSAICELLGTRPQLKVKLTFYEDEESKKQATGHAGLGWATDTSIVEVYNDSIQLDPYHELVHIVGGTVGHPTALFDEGFAVYVSERLGADALAYMGYKGMSISAAACLLVSSGKALPLGQLFDFTELGSKGSQGPVSYPQSASVVQYLIEHHGIERFRAAYRELRNSAETPVREENKRIFRTIYGMSVENIEQEWRNSVCSNDD